MFLQLYAFSPENLIVPLKSVTSSVSKLLGTLTEAFYGETSKGRFWEQLFVVFFPCGGGGVKKL